MTDPAGNHQPATKVTGPNLPAGARATTPAAAIPARYARSHQARSSGLLTAQIRQIFRAAMRGAAAAVVTECECKHEWRGR